jgi:hypothetical protein
MCPSRRLADTSTLSGRTRAVGKNRLAARADRTAITDPVQVTAASVSAHETAASSPFRHSESAAARRRIQNRPRVASPVANRSSARTTTGRRTRSSGRTSPIRKPASHRVAKRAPDCRDPRVEESSRARSRWSAEDRPTASSFGVSGTFASRSTISRRGEQSEPASRSDRRVDHRGVFEAPTGVCGAV